MTLCPPSYGIPPPTPPPSGFIAGPKYNPEAWRTLESTFQSGVLRLIGGCDDSSVDMGRRRDVSLADVVVLVETLGAVRAEDGTIKVVDVPLGGT